MKRLIVEEGATAEFEEAAARHEAEDARVDVGLTLRMALRARRTWCLLVVTALAFSCGGKSASRREAGQGGAGGSVTLAGSSFGGIGTQAAGGDAGAEGAQGGFAAVIEVGGEGGVGGSESGAGGEAGGACGVNSLLTAIEQNGGSPSCREASPMLGPGERLGMLRGAMVLDDEGRVVDITGLSGDKLQGWLDDLANQRWPCLAGQTIGYACVTPV